MLELFPQKKRENFAVGKANVKYRSVSSILTKASGFMESYDFTLNPYSGCSFGCTYCYAAFFSKSQEERENWGYWVDIKENALDLLKKFRKKPLREKTIYMSSVTDPYQPIERELKLVRELLNELLDYHQPRLVIQTRSNLVTRDIDLLRKFNTVQVNMTITTDSERVRKIFEPLCPSNAIRMNAISEVAAAGVNACITMTPLLPIENPEAFAKSLKETNVQKFIVQPFHSDRGKFIAGTREKALKLIKDMNWTNDRYKSVESILIDSLPQVGIGKDGFKAI